MLQRKTNMKTQNNKQETTLNIYETLKVKSFKEIKDYLTKNEIDFTNFEQELAERQNDKYYYIVLDDYQEIRFIELYEDEIENFFIEQYFLFIGLDLDWEIQEKLSFVIDFDKLYNLFAKYNFTIIKVEMENN